MKNKMLVLFEIAIVLCSVFLVAIPAIAAEQNQAMQKASVVTTASEDDYVLGVYGNANEDETIDMGDVVYTKLAIFGKKPKTELCDAKYDGRINVLDVIQTNLIILGKEKELTIVDSADRIVTVKKPLKRIVSTFTWCLETFRSLKVPKDIIVGVSTTIQSEKHGGHYQILFPEYQDKPTITTKDLESIIILHPDAVFAHLGGYGSYPELCDRLESAGITGLGFYYNYGKGAAMYTDEVKKLGYILDKEKEADEFLNFREKCQSLIKEKVEKIPEEDKPTVYYEYSSKYKSYYFHATFIDQIGGKNIFPDEMEIYGSVDPEAVIERAPDIILKVTPSGIHSGYELDAGNTEPLKEVRGEIMSRPELQDVTAVKTGKVYVISNCLVSGGPKGGCIRFIQNLYVVKWFHPELFEDLDPQAIHQEYLTRFQGLDIDLDEKGVFVYPEPS